MQRYNTSVMWALINELLITFLYHTEETVMSELYFRIFRSCRKYVSYAADLPINIYNINCRLVYANCFNLLDTTSNKTEY